MFFFFYNKKNQNIWAFFFVCMYFVGLLCLFFVILSNIDNVIYLDYLSSQIMSCTHNDVSIWCLYILIFVMLAIRLMNAQ